MLRKSAKNPSIFCEKSGIVPILWITFLFFPPKAQFSPYVVDNFRPAIAIAYRLAQANMAYSRFSFFFNPRYTVFL